MPVNISPRNTIRSALTGSLKRKMPSSTAPKAPIPAIISYTQAMLPPPYKKIKPERYHLDNSPRLLSFRDTA